MHKVLHSVVLRTVKPFYITFCINVTMAIFTLETDYLSLTGYPLDIIHARQTICLNVKMERFLFWTNNV